MFRKILQSILACMLFFSILSPPMFTEKAYAYSSSPLLTIIPEKLQSTNAVFEGSRYSVKKADYSIQKDNGHWRSYIDNWVTTREVGFRDSDKPYVQLRFRNAVQDANGNFYDLRLKVTVLQSNAANSCYFYWYKTDDRSEYENLEYATNLEIPTAQSHVWVDYGDRELKGAREDGKWLCSRFDLEVIGAPYGSYYELYFGDIDMTHKNPYRITKEGISLGSNMRLLNMGSSLEMVHEPANMDTSGGSLPGVTSDWIQPTSDYFRNAEIGDRSYSVSARADRTSTFFWKGSSCGTCILSFNNNVYTKVTKVDSDTYSKIWATGGHLRFRDSSGTIVAERDIVNGTVEVALPEGSYTIEETSAPQGYQRETQPKRVYLSGKYQEVTFGNEKLKNDFVPPPPPPPPPPPETPKVKIKLKKTDDYTGTDRTKYPLAGATFLVRASGKTFNLTTNDKGYTPEIEVAKGSDLYIGEIEPPEGHVAMADIMQVEGSRVVNGATIEVFNAIEKPKHVPFTLDIRKSLIRGSSSEALPQLHTGDINFVLAKWLPRDGWTAERVVTTLNPNSTITYANTNARDVGKIDFSDPAYVINGTPLKENGKVVLDDGIYMLRETKTTPFYSADSSGQFLKNSLVAGKNVFKVENGVISDISLKNTNKQVDNGLKPRIGKIVVTKQDKDKQALQGVVFNLYESATATTPL